MYKLAVKISLLVLGMVFAVSSWAEMDVRGNLSLELRQFPTSALDSRQHGSNISASIEPEFSWSWNDGLDSLTFAPFIRQDEGDDKRSHADLRELMWLHVADNWELRTGVGKVFWGVTEAQHLVDIINQTDQVENPDGEDKLGQPMIWLSFPKNWGTLDMFVLPGFRERTYQGVSGRLRTSPRVIDWNSGYESNDEDSHVDYALRWSHYLGAFEIGLSWFDGTSRSPQLLPQNNADGEIVSTPYYPLVEQLGVDLTAAVESWLLKLEVVRRSYTSLENYTALSAGFEYTFSSFMGSRFDLGLISEYLYDSRENGGPFQDDIFAGVRIAFNDAQSSELLAGVIGDRDNGTRLYNLEASRRLGNQWKMALEARLFSSVHEQDPLYSRRNDDYVELNFTYFF
ncbi:MAG: hypothetical protein ACI8P9_001907 [Parasphingorhabdus sp.]|jgi:hypothetical protein